MEIRIEKNQETRLFRKISHRFAFKCRAKQGFRLKDDAAILACDEMNTLFMISTLKDWHSHNLIDVGLDFERRVHAVEVIEIGSRLIIVAQF